MTDQPLITVAEAALLTGRAPATIRKWLERGYLQPVRRGRRGTALLALDDVWDVERDTRRRDRRGPS